jgi:hypothetical protein
MKGPVFTEVGWSSKPLQTELAFKWPLPSVNPTEWKQDIIRVKRVLDRLIIIIPQKTLTFVEPRLPLQGIRHNALYKYFNEHYDTGTE